MPARPVCVLDASALAKRILDEEHAVELSDWVDAAANDGWDLLVPHLARYELGHLLSRRMGRSPPHERAELLDRALAGARFADGAGIEDHFPPLSYYDASYLALARATRATFVTYDQVLAGAARAAGIPVLSPGLTP